MLPHHIEQDQGVDQIVGVVLQGLLYTLPHRFQAREMDDCPDIRVALEQRFHLLWVAQLRLNEGDLPSHDLLHPPNRFPAGIHQIVRHHDVISRLDQLHTGVATDISGATAHQNGHRSLLFCHDPLSLGKLL